MIQLTTPTHRFRLKLNTDQIEAVRISYAQNENVLLVKTLEDCTIDGQVITVKLSQEDTNEFTAGIPITIQLNVKTVDGSRLTSRKFTIQLADNQDKTYM